MMSNKDRICIAYFLLFIPTLGIAYFLHDLELTIISMGGLISVAFGHSLLRD